MSVCIEGSENFAAVRWHRRYSSNLRMYLLACMCRSLRVIVNEVSSITRTIRSLSRTFNCPLVCHHPTHSLNQLLTD